MTAKRLLLGAAACLCALLPLYAEDTAGSVITIIQAQTTEYTKDPVAGGEVIVFKGDAVVSVARDDSTNIIRAALINYSRERDLLVEFIRTSKRGIIKPYESKRAEA